MAGIDTIVDYLEGKGVRLSLENGELMCRASRAVATDDIRTIVATLKPGIIRHLSGAVHPDIDTSGFDIGPLAPIKHTPPPECVGPIACSRLGACERRTIGHPCLMNASKEAA